MRIRIRFTKLGKIRFLGHRDLARCWERAVRRAELPVAYSEGFSPRQRLHYGLALPTGAESVAEYMDIDLTSPVDLVGLDKLLADGLPDGVDVVGVAEVAPNATALQAVVDRCTWELAINGVERDDVLAAVDRLLAADDVPLTFERKGKRVTENVRPCVVAITVHDEPADANDRGDGRATVLTVDLATRPRSIRPSEFLSCLDAGGDAGRVCRIEQWMTIDGHLEPPLAAGDPSRPAPSPA